MDDDTEVHKHSQRIKEDWEALYPNQKIALIVGLRRSLTGKPQVLVQHYVNVPEVSHSFWNGVNAPDEFSDEVKVLMSHFGENKLLEDKLAQEREEMQRRHQEELAEMEARHRKKREDM